MSKVNNKKTEENAQNTNETMPSVPKKGFLQSLFGASGSEVTEERKHTSSRSIRLINDESKFAVREAYKTLRTNIIFALPREESSVILITSSWPMEGKTTNCANLAVVFSQMGEKTLLIDGDLRKPRIHKIFKLPSKLGLSNVLRRLCTFDEAIQHTQYDNLDILSSGLIPPNPAELLGSEEMKALIEEAKKKYKYILIDTPPVNMVSDAIVMAPLVSGMVVVVRQNITVHKSVTEALEKIDFTGAKILGFILNDSANAEGSYYSGKKRYGYKKGYYSGYYYGYYGYGNSGKKNTSGKTDKNGKTKE